MQEILENLLSESLQKEVQIHQMRQLGGGCINHACHVMTSEGEYFAKWNSQGAADMFLREAESLEALAEATSLVIPRVFVKTAAKDAAPAFLVTDFLPPASGNRQAQDEILGRGIAELHRHTQAQYGFYHDNYCGSTPQDNTWNSDWVDFFGQQRIAFLLNLIDRKQGFSSSEKKQFDQLLGKLPDLIGHQPEASLNHGDLWSGNYMYTAQGPALIDPASYFADREFDLALMAMFGGYNDRVWQAYQEDYPLPPAWQDRRDVYMLYHYLNHYYLFGGGYGQQSLSIVKKYIK